jgi:hypothetical protein
VGDVIYNAAKAHDEAFHPSICNSQYWWCQWGKSLDEAGEVHVFNATCQVAPMWCAQNLMGSTVSVRS